MGAAFQWDPSWVCHQPPSRKPKRQISLQPLSINREHITFVSFVLALGFGSFVLPAMAQATDSEFFEKQIRPILEEHCHTCHNSEMKIAQLDLTTSQGFQTGGQSGPIVSPENFEHSRILKVISYKENVKMPPSGKLEEPKIAALKDWVR